MTYLRDIVFVRIAAFLALACAAFAPNARALGPHGDAFAGYSNISGASGWEATLHLKVAPFIGVEGDVAGYGYGVSNTNQRVYLFLVGPRVSLGTKHVTAFVHGLVGAGRGAYQESDDAELVYAVGGGLDFRVVSRLSWRAAGDLVGVPLSSVTNPRTGRFTTGPVFRF